MISTTIQMNDVIILQGRKYLINSMEMDYSTGVAKLELIDWMDFEQI